jgi:hypothetical protein
VDTSRHVLDFGQANRLQLGELVDLEIRVALLDQEFDLGFRLSLGASKPATHGRFKTSHPFRVVTVVNSTILNGFGVAFRLLTFAGSHGPIRQGLPFPKRILPPVA